MCVIFVVSVLIFESKTACTTAAFIVRSKLYAGTSLYYNTIFLCLCIYQKQEAKLSLG